MDLMIIEFIKHLSINFLVFETKVHVFNCSEGVKILFVSMLKIGTNFI